METFKFALSKAITWLAVQLILVAAVIEGFLNPLLGYPVSLIDCLYGVILAWTMNDGRELLTLWFERKNIHSITD